MKLVDEFRDPQAVRGLARAIERAATRPFTLMEVCGGQTHALLRFGIDRLLPPRIELVHGPGCPVCVTPPEILDQAAELAARPGVILCTFGDMLRVPGSRTDLLSARAAGADVRVVYSPLDALRLAQAEPRAEVVFLAVGFETTVPSTALAVRQAARAGTRNFSLLVSHVRVPPAMAALLEAPGCRVEGFLAAGHVCTVMGFSEYEPLAARYRVPIAVTGFEPVDLLRGILACIEQLESGRHEVENLYTRSVRPDGNPHARALLDEVFELAPMRWRGLGEIAASGLRLRPAYAGFDAERKLGSATPAPCPDEPRCQSGLVLQGRLRPCDCPEFGRGCTPERPLGAPMVSSEGACAAYFRYRTDRKDRKDRKDLGTA
jgi:hydrogenase expression/formation protein HypD